MVPGISPNAIQMKYWNNKSCIQQPSHCYSIAYLNFEITIRELQLKLYSQDSNSVTEEKKNCSLTRKNLDNRTALQYFTYQEP